MSGSEATKASSKGGRRGPRQANAKAAEVPGKPDGKDNIIAQPNSDQSKSLVNRRGL